MFLKGSLFDICIVEVKWTVGRFSILIREDYFLCLFSWVQVENHFPLSDPIINLLQVFVKIIRRGNIARSVFLNLRNLLLYLKAFVIFHLVLVCKSNLHTKLAIENFENIS